jgi:AcrR family transcriptional regulator
MARPKTIDDAVILKAARVLFFKKGAATTTAEVARLAGVAEGTIFKRFKSKPELFRACMGTESLPWMARLEEGRDGDLEKVLVEVAMDVIAFARKVIPLMMMTWSNRGEFGPVGAKRSFRPADDFVEFFERQMKAGRIRKGDAGALTAAYYGALQHYAMVELIRGGKHPLDQKDFVRNFVHCLWVGIAPERKGK